MSDFQTSSTNAPILTASKTNKLNEKFHPKKNYVVHYHNLKFYVNNGIKINKVHRAVKLRQSKWLSSYIALNTLDQDFCTLMSKSIFGKFCQCLRNRVSVLFVRTEEELLKATSEVNISLIKIKDENLTLIAKRKQRYHKLYKRSNEKIVSKFKDDLGDHQYSSFVPLNQNFILFSLLTGKRKCLPKPNCTMRCSKNVRNL